MTPGVGVTPGEAGIVSPAPLTCTGWLRNGLLVLAVFGIALSGSLFGEKIQYYNGLGMDGALYGRWAAHSLPIIQTPVNDEQLQRVLPSLAAAFVMRLLALPPSEEGVVRAFSMLNVGLITLTAAVLCGIGRHLALGTRGTLLAFAGLFLNYALLKWAAYYPVLTDMTALTISVCMLYAYLRNDTVALCGLTVLGGFTFPTLPLQGLVLLLFPRRPANGIAGQPLPYRINALLAAAVTALLVWHAHALVGVRTDLQLPKGAVEPWLTVLPLSVAVAVAYVFLGLCSILNSRALLDWRQLTTGIIRPGFWIALLVLYAVQHPLLSLSTDAAPPSMVIEVVLSAIMRPGLFLVAHVAFFGPIILLACMWWPSICRGIHRAGLGLTVLIAGLLPVTINSESRHLITLFPLLVPFVAQVAEARCWRPLHYALFAALSVAASRVWLSLGGAPFDQDPTDPIEQFYYMSHGPYMMQSSYFILGAAMLGLLALLLAHEVVDRRHDTAMSVAR
jgi:hypothetical protein